MVQSYPSKPSEIPNYFKIKRSFFEPSETIRDVFFGLPPTWKGGRRKKTGKKPSTCNDRFSRFPEAVIGPSWWLNSPTGSDSLCRPSNWIISPNIRGEIKEYLSCHVPSGFFWGMVKKTASHFYDFHFIFC